MNKSSMKESLIVFIALQKVASLSRLMFLDYVTAFGHNSSWISTRRKRRNWWTSCCLPPGNSFLTCFYRFFRFKVFFFPLAT